jgi:hypothetical protein
MIDAAITTAMAVAVAPAVIGGAALFSTARKCCGAVIFHSIAREKRLDFSYTTPAIFKQFCQLYHDQYHQSPTVSSR